MFWKVISVGFLLVLGSIALSLDKMVWNTKVIHAKDGSWIEYNARQDKYRICGAKNKGIRCLDWITIRH